MVAPPVQAVTIAVLMRAAAPPAPQANRLEEVGRRLGVGSEQSTFLPAVFVRFVLISIWHDDYCRRNSLRFLRCWAIWDLGLDHMFQLRGWLLLRRTHASIGGK